MAIQTLQTVTRRYRLHNPSATNEEIMKCLDPRGWASWEGLFFIPSCTHGRPGLVGFRFKLDEVALFRGLDWLHENMNSLAHEIHEEEPEETHA